MFFGLVQDLLRPCSVCHFYRVPKCLKRGLSLSIQVYTNMYFCIFVFVYLCICILLHVFVYFCICAFVLYLCHLPHAFMFKERPAAANPPKATLPCGTSLLQRIFNMFKHSLYCFFFVQDCVFRW